MLTFKPIQKLTSFRRLIAGMIGFAFIVTIICPTQAVAQTVFNLPAPGTVITLSQPFTPSLVRGITLYPDNPLKFDFIVDVGDDHLVGDAFQKESMKLIKYFLVSLTVPENDMWVNLSPYEKDRIVPEHFGQTEMGRDLLLQDYILKQLTASFMNPDQKVGAEFWDKVRQKAKEQFGTTDVPTDIFNKVWIVPDKAQVYVKGQSVFVVESHLKVMLEEDYVAMNHNKENMATSRAVNQKEDSLRGNTIEENNDLQRKSLVTNENKSDPRDNFNSRQSLNQLIKEIIIPAIEVEVNEGKNFALLRQIQNSAILAAWYKKNLKETFLGKVYIDQKKTEGINSDDKEAAEKIYHQYVESFKKGVYDFVKEDYDPTTQEMIPRKYFSGGMVEANTPVLTEGSAESGARLATEFVGREAGTTTVELESSAPPMPVSQPLSDAAVPTTDKPKITPPRAGSTQGEVETAIRKSVLEYNEDTIDINQAADNIVAFIVNAEDTEEFVVTLEKAIEVLKLTADPKYEAFLAIFEKYQTQTDHTGLFEEIQELNQQQAIIVNSDDTNTNKREIDKGLINKRRMKLKQIASGLKEAKTLSEIHQMLVAYEEFKDVTLTDVRNDYNQKNPYFYKNENVSPGKKVNEFVQMRRGKLKEIAGGLIEPKTLPDIHQMLVANKEFEDVTLMDVWNDYLQQKSAFYQHPKVNAEKISDKRRLKLKEIAEGLEEKKTIEEIYLILLKNKEFEGVKLTDVRNDYYLRKSVFYKHEMVRTGKVNKRNKEHGIESRGYEKEEVKNFRKWVEGKQGQKFDQTQEEIAEEQGVSVKTVKKYGVETKGRGAISKEVKEFRIWAEEMRGQIEDKTRKEIAKKFGVSLSTVDNIYKEYGIESRMGRFKEGAKQLRQWAKANPGQTVDQTRIQIAEWFGVSRGTVDNIFNEYEIKTQKGGITEEAKPFQPWAEVNPVQNVQYAIITNGSGLNPNGKIQLYSRSKPEVARPTAGSTDGLVHEAILKAAGEYENENITIGQAADMIVEALVTATEPEFIINLQTAIDILASASIQKYEIILKILRKYNDEKDQVRYTDHTGLFEEIAKSKELRAKSQKDNYGGVPGDEGGVSRQQSRLKLAYKDLTSIGIKYFASGTQALVETKKGWPFVLKLFMDEPSEQIFSAQSEESYDIAWQFLGGLVADFAFVDIENANGNIETAIIMRKVELDDLATQIETADENRRKQLIEDNIRLLLEIIRRGVFPVDSKFKNFGLINNRQVILDPGLILKKIDQNNINEFVATTRLNFNYLNALNPNLGSFYMDILRQYSLDEDHLERTIHDNFGKNLSQAVPDISKEIEDSLSRPELPGGIDLNADEKPVDVTRVSKIITLKKELLDDLKRILGVDYSSEDLGENFLVRLSRQILTHYDLKHKVELLKVLERVDKEFLSLMNEDSQGLEGRLANVMPEAGLWLAYALFPAIDQQDYLARVEALGDLSLGGSLFYIGMIGPHVRDESHSDDLPALAILLNKVIPQMGEKLKDSEDLKTMKELKKYSRMIANGLAIPILEKSYQEWFFSLSEETQGFILEIFRKYISLEDINSGDLFKTPIADAESAVKDLARSGGAHTVYDIVLGNIDTGDEVSSVYSKIVKANLMFIYNLAHTRQIGVDSASQAPNNGGIDLNANEKTLVEEGDTIKLPVDSSDWQNFQTNGFVPVIINITLPMSLPLILSQSGTPKESSIAMRSVN